MKVNRDYAELVDDDFEGEKKLCNRDRMACFFACLMLIGIFTYFFYVAITDARDAFDIDGFKEEFGPFLNAISYQFNDSYPLLAQQMVTKYGDFMLASLAMAISSQMQGNDTGAQYWLKEARDHQDDKYRRLLPASDEWTNETTPQALYQLIPGAVWAVPYYYTLDSRQYFPAFETGYIVKLNATTTFFLNPVPLSNDVYNQVINEIGPVGYLIEQTKNHYRFLPEATAQFPMAQVYGVETQENFPPVTDLNISFTGYLNDTTPLFPDNITQITMQGHEYGEVALYHPASQTLFFSDLLYLSDWKGYVVGGYQNKTSFFSRMWFWEYGAYGNLAVPSDTDDLITDKKAFAASIKAVEKLKYKNIFLTMGGRVVSKASSSLKDAFEDYT